MGSDENRRPLGESGNPRGRRLGLLAFGAIFVALFVIVAIAEGVGDPSIPPGDVALVEEVPPGIGEISQARFEHALVVMAAQRREETVPKPGEPRYDEVKEVTLNTMFESIRTEALAAEWGLGVSDEAVARRKKYVKRVSFGSEAAFKRFRQELHLSTADVDEQFKLEMIGARIRKRLGEEAPRSRSLKMEYVADFNAGFEALWDSRTLCAPGYVTQDCSNASPAAHPSTAPAACYESSSFRGLPSACPAPVSQLIPALPGSVTPLRPRGEALAQRPLPADEG